MRPPGLGRLAEVPARAGVEPAPGREATPQARSSFAIFAALEGFWRRWGVRSLLQPKTRRLRVTETVSLGDKRFVSIVEVDGASFLIGGGTATVSLLTPLAERSFQGAVESAWQQRESA